MSKYPDWTNEEILILKENYPYCNSKEMEKLLPNRKTLNINSKASQLGIKKVKKWNESDISLLKECFGKGMSIYEIVDKFEGKYSYGSIQSKANKLGLRTRGSWAEDEIKIMNEHYPYEPIEDFIDLLNNRSRHAVIGMAIKLGLNSYLTWKDDEIQFLLDNWEILSDYEIALKLNKSQLCVKTKRHSLKLYRMNKEERNYRDLTNFLRSNISDWKLESMKRSDYKCVVTGDKFDDIHHLFSVSTMVKMVFDNLNIQFKPCEEYTNDELDIILKEFKKVQSQYPFGVCLRHDIHVLFHNLFGKTNNTPEQFYIFKENYNKGLYNDYINDHLQNA